MNSVKSIKTIKFKIKPDNNLIHILNQWFGASKFAWNYFYKLVFETDYMNKDDKFKFTKITLRNHIRKNGPEWIKEGSPYINGTLVENVAIDFIKAYNKFKKKASKLLCFMPVSEIQKYKPSKRNKKSKNSCIINRKNKYTFKLENNILYFNTTRNFGRQKVELDIKTKIDSSSIKQLIFTKDNDEYFVSLVYENIVKEKPYTNNTKIGIDLGIKNFATCYDGNKYFVIKYPKEFDKLIDKIKNIESKFSKTKKYSKNHKILLKRLNKAYKRFINSRNNWQDHIVKDLTSKYETILLDNYPTELNSYRKINKIKTNLSIGRFVRKLELKTEELGSTLIKVKNGTPTTQTCSNCGHVLQGKDKLTLDDRVYKCKECGHEQDRDENSANNIYNYIV